MKRIRDFFTAMTMAFSMFCAIPCPFHAWRDELRGASTLFLPVVGAFIGALWMAASYVLEVLAAPVFICAAVMCAYPILITGGIHMDGFLDVTDAVKSWRDVDEKRRILKDPHVGSFAVINCALYIMAEFALFASAKDGANMLSLLFIPTASRAAAAFAVTVLRPMAHSEYAGAHKHGVKRSHIIVTVVEIIVCISGAFLCGVDCGAASSATVAGYAAASFCAFRSLDGMSGDVSGYALVIGELCGVAVFALM